MAASPDEYQAALTAHGISCDHPARFRLGADLIAPTVARVDPDAWECGVCHFIHVALPTDPERPEEGCGRCGHPLASHIPECFAVVRKDRDFCDCNGFTGPRPDERLAHRR